MSSIERAIAQAALRQLVPIIERKFDELRADAVEGFLSREAMAEALDVDPSTVTRWADQGLIPFVTIGSRRRYPRAFLAELRRGCSNGSR